MICALSLSRFHLSRGRGGKNQQRQEVLEPHGRRGPRADGRFSIRGRKHRRGRCGCVIGHFGQTSTQRRRNIFSFWKPTCKQLQTTRRTNANAEDVSGRRASKAIRPLKQIYKAPSAPPHPVAYGPLSAAARFHGQGSGLQTNCALVW